MMKKDSVFLINSYDDLQKKAIKKKIPLHTLFELIYRCNLKCKHCYIIKDKRKELSKKEIFKILESLKDAGCLYLTFSGGEPFLREDFFKIAEYANELNFFLRLFTNGTFIDEKKADMIEKLNFFSLEISLYGFENTHEKITGVEGSYKKSISAIKMLKERGIKVFVKTTLMKNNVDEVWRFKKYVKNDLNVDWRGTGGGLLLSPCDDGNRKPLRYRLTDRQLKKYIKAELKEFELSGNEYKPRTTKQKESLCGAGFANCNITPYGELNPCVQLRLKGNNLKDTSVKKIYREHEGFKNIRNLRMDDKKDCIDCEYLPYCFVCPGIALLEKRSLKAKLPEACRQAKMRKEAYEEIRAGY